MTEVTTRTASVRADTLLARFLEVRAGSETLAAPLSPEDAQIQSMPDASPTKWHLAHSTWFFETFLLRDFLPAYRPFDPDYHYLFNSYYEAEGPRHRRDRRGMLSRPMLADVLRYRTAVTDALHEALPCWQSRDDWPRIAALIELGCQHEEQHQELILTDIKHALAENPLEPAYATIAGEAAEGEAAPLEFVAFEEGIYPIGHDGTGFAYDNEGPRHRRLIAAFRLASRTVTCGEYAEFIADGGYRTPGLWLSEGYDWVRANAIGMPLYWRLEEGGYSIFTLRGRRPLRMDEPVVHLSLYEADAFARWAGARLPREEELELAARKMPMEAEVNDARTGRFHPRVITREDRRRSAIPDLAGNVWEWTMSAYASYPGFRPIEGAIGEYNGKFMVNQYVLRGGSCATPKGHWRPSYRNFFPAAARWQFSGLRLAKDI